MNTQSKAFPLKHLIVVTADGRLNVEASKKALKSLREDPNFDSRSEVLLDLRDVECVMSVTDIFDIAEFMTFPNPALPTNKKIAVLVAGQLAFNHAHFLEMCAQNRGLNIRSFDDYDQADVWLNADLPSDPKGNLTARQRTPALLAD